MTGQTISHYRIGEKLGEGGMGVVYKAEDTKLERAVALKFLSPLLVQDAEVRKRFEREAKAAAALSHPNVCTVHEIDEANGRMFIAMEFVEGDSLDKKIEPGPLKLEEALGVAGQIAKGLEAAHKKKIYHRDIKPQNVMVGEDGHVTVMDFGLAQLADRSRLTRDDTTLGTVTYMSPEQTEGAGTDHHTDIWSLGVVLYEMITGRQPFRGDYEQAVMYSILNERPEPITALRTGVPLELERVTNKCLAKKTEERYQAAADLIVDLQAVTGASVGAARAIPVAPDSAPRRTHPWPALAAAAALLVVGVSWLHFTEPEPKRPVRKFTLTPEGFQSSEARPAISPNGEYIVYSAGTPEMSLWVRPLDLETPRRLEGTEGARRPFWSPDSEFIGFAAAGSLKRAPVSGGPTGDICRLPGGSRFFLGAWRPDGESIVFASQSPTRLFEVSARGGEPRLTVSRAASEEAVWASSPQFLSDRILLYRVGTPFLGESLVARDMETGEEQKWPVPAGAFAYSPTGHILYQPHSRFTGDLWALPFSSEPMGPSGPPFPIASNAGWPSVADEAVLVYRQEGAPQTFRVRIVDRSGAEIDDTDRRWRLGSTPAFSPNGKRLIVSVSNTDSQDIWLYNLINRNWTRLAGDPSTEIFPVWAPDGERVSTRPAGVATDRSFITSKGRPWWPSR